MSFVDVIFSQFPKNKVKRRKHLLRVHSRYKDTAYTIQKTNSFTSRRMSSCLRSIPAAISVEASLAIPLFIFFMANLMMLIIIFGTYCRTLSVVQQEARSIALTSFEMSESEIVKIERALTISPLIKKIGFDSGYTRVSMNYRRWNGYDVLGESEEIKEEEYVYVAKYGKVYHKDRECRYLNIKIRAVLEADIENEYNNSHEHYSACELCRGAGTGILFVTEEGNRYHASVNCSGLKRTVDVVKLSEVEGMGACSGCVR